ncbi:YrrS family protein [Litchfieldia alkalitelluris]|uniref:YrrS family protein n=1 Tax=Litchfieldia alkalitelluris TaxID=304268 RepID=UPI00099729F7|nr:YrrS family protein [Litchfieldia alkalitelluris]
MGYDLEKLYVGPRSEKLHKRRKVNRILNLLIIFVFALILFFGWRLFFSNANQAGTAEQPSTSEQTQPASDGEDNSAVVDDSDNEETAETSEPSEEELEETTAPESESSEHETVTDGDPDSNIIRSIVNNAWTPIGTKQEGTHTVNYEKGSADRNEMEQAIGYATGKNQEDLTVWQLSRNGEHQVAATVSTKDNSHIYRVYIEWVDKEGWKPIKIDELRKNDSEYYTGE